MSPERLQRAASRLWKLAVAADKAAHRANDLHGGPYVVDGWNDVAWRFNRLACRHWYRRDRVYSHMARPDLMACTCGGAQ